ncbi:MAG: diacylglycerol kinase family lipid kinase [Actinomycetota bacterium]|nr:diacylglycerol kinase family lipid kinase [Actinomycetota bacterium]
MRLLLVANANATIVTPHMTSVIEHALASEFDVDLVATKRGGHAMHLAQGAEHGGYDLVVAFGGDGTVNEVANGLAGTKLPMAIIPGGGTNVLARSLGISPDPIEATGQLLANRRKDPRRVTLGRADGRHFTFTCGMGFDGAIVRRVERRQGLKKAGGGGYYAWSALAVLLRYGRRPAVTVRWGPDLAEAREGLFLAITQNARPYTYLGEREMHLCPDADIDAGIDCLAVASMRVSFLLRTVVRAFGSARHARSKHVLALHDQDRIEIAADRPLPVQMDGEYLGDRDYLLVEAVPDALSILA